MVTGSTVYWITRLDAVCLFLEIFGFLSLVAGVIATIGCLANEIRYWPILTCTIAILGLSLMIGRVFVPNTKEACAILVIPRVINNEKVQEMPEKILDLADLWIEEMKPNKKEK